MLCAAAVLVAALACSQDNPVPPPAGQQEPAALQKRIGELIARLLDDNWQTRETAALDLVAVGKPALSALREALLKARVTDQHPFLAVIQAINPKPSLVLKPDNPTIRGLTIIIDRSEQRRRAIEAHEADMLDLLDGFGARFELVLDLVCVTDLTTDSSADKIGLQIGDFPGKANGKPLVTLGEVKQLLDKPQVEAPVELEVIRGGKTVALSFPSTKSP